MTKDIFRRMIPHLHRVFVFIFPILLLGSWSVNAYGYIGPGAGFAFVSSFFILFITILLALVTLVTWPLRWLFQVFRSDPYKKSKFKRIIILGFDGQDPDLTSQWMEKGYLPNFQKLKEQGSFHKLRTTLPAESPVAWSSFQTGCNPGKHRIFDFLVPNRRNYLPELSSAHVDSGRRKINLGLFQISYGKPVLQINRKSQPFWKILGEHRIFSTILRVPITFPAEPFKGLLLSAMSVPDLKGTQGTFSYYTTDSQEADTMTGGRVFHLHEENGCYRSILEGIENPKNKKSPGFLTTGFSLKPTRDPDSFILEIQGNRIHLKKGEFSSWIEVTFKPTLYSKVSGICRFYLRSTTPEIRLYVTPLNIDPNRPALPISHPPAYAIYLSKMIGRYSTLGLAEDTWALNERALDEEGFLAQAYLIQDEREKMLQDALKRTRKGCVVCVFDLTDRVQHMFWRTQEDHHPANRDKPIDPYRHTIRDVYQRMDTLLGKVMVELDDQTLLLVMSDHGFKSFQRGVNLNTWLYQHGYLVLKGEPDGTPWFAQVDWRRTQAYAVGLGGIYLNLKGREACGVVDKGEQQKVLIQEIRTKLSELHDPLLNCPVVSKVYMPQELYSGPYTSDAPDLIAGFHQGYRVSWASAIASVTPELFEDNQKAWSGDHCINPEHVPGMLFSNHAIEQTDPGIMDLAPTVLSCFGIQPPSYMDGVALTFRSGS